jgi:hypothetical protein
MIAIGRAVGIVGLSHGSSVVSNFTLNHHHHHITAPLIDFSSKLCIGFPDMT